jgi:hypothetical protein
MLARAIVLFEVSRNIFIIHFTKDKRVNAQNITELW